jgi:DNA-binding beta-propeller fold protein YncE
MDADEVLRSRLSLTPKSVPALRPQLDQVRKRARTRHRRRRAVAGASATILLAGVGLPIWLLSGLGGPAPSHVLITPSPSLRPVLVASIDVRGSVDLVVGEHAIWVAGFRVVSRVDPVSSDVVATVKTPGTGDYSRLAVGFGAVWVTAGQGRVYRIDPNNDRVLATIHVGGSVEGIETGGGYVWVTRPTGAVGDLIKIDPATNRVAGDPIKVGPSPIAVAYGFGAVWVTNTSPPSVVRVDPLSGSVASLGFTGIVGVGPDSLWVASDDSVARVDPNTGTVTASIQVPRAQTLAVGEGRVWVLAAPKSSSPTLFYPIKHTAALWEIDPATNAIVGRAVRLDALQPIALAVGEAAVWVADYSSGSVSHFGLEL